MARKLDETVKIVLEAIEKHKLVFIDDIIAYVPFTRATFYNKGLDKMDAIKEALDKNKVNMKNGLRAKWYKGDNPTAQIALYKLIGTEDECDRLSGTKQKMDITTGGQPFAVKPYDFIADADKNPE
jgi:hypothetical protein